MAITRGLPKGLSVIVYSKSFLVVVWYPSGAIVKVKSLAGKVCMILYLFAVALYDISCLKALAHSDVQRFQSMWLYFLCLQLFITSQRTGHVCQQETTMYTSFLACFLQ